jgi:uncharacterized membrane protein (Fun14 family)
MKLIFSVGVFVVVALIGAVLATAIPLQQQASVIVINWKDFKKLTHEFEKNVISGQWNPGDTPPTRELLASYIVDVKDTSRRSRYVTTPDTEL